MKYTYIGENKKAAEEKAVVTKMLHNYQNRVTDFFNNSLVVSREYSVNSLKAKLPHFHGNKNNIWE